MDLLDQDEIKDQIRRLEARRYEAMRRSDERVLEELPSPDLIYSHSFGDRDSKSSYMEEICSGTITYEHVSNAVDKIVVVNRTALVAGTMTATATVKGSIRTVNNASLALWSQYSDSTWSAINRRPYQSHYSERPKPATLDR